MSGNQSQGSRISNFPANTAIPSGSELTFVLDGVNYKITLANFLAALNVTGSIIQDGAVTGTPVLDVAGTVNNIRNLENGPGFQASVSPENGITVEHNFTANEDGIAVLKDPTADSPVIRSISAGAGISVTLAGDNQEEIEISTSGTPATTKTVIVNVLGDFPTPVGGVITLAGGTEYFLNNDINIGTNRFVMGDGTVLRGSDSSVITLTATGSNDLFTATDVTFRIDSISINCASCRVFNATNVAKTKLLQMIDMTVIACDTIGSLSGYSAIQVNNVAFLAVATSGITLAGNSGAIFALVCLINMTDGSFIDLSTFTVDSMTVNNSLFTLVAATSFGITGTGSTNIVSIGTMVNCRASGSGALLNGITVDDEKWQFDLNDDIPDSRPDALMSLQSNATETVITVAGTPILVAGTWVVEDSSQMTATTGGRATYDGVKDARLPITASVSVEPVSGTNITVSACVAINGTVVPNSLRSGTATAGAPTSITVPWQETFSNGDFVEIFVANEDTTSNLIVSSAVHRVN